MYMKALTFNVLDSKNKLNSEMREEGITTRRILLPVGHLSQSLAALKGIHQCTRLFPSLQQNLSLLPISRKVIKDIH